MGATQYQMTRHWPEYIHWSVGDSTVNSETATFTVNGITARQWLVRVGTRPTSSP
jgi:hypothetical protein